MSWMGHNFFCYAGEGIKERDFVIWLCSYGLTGNHFRSGYCDGEEKNLASCAYDLVARFLSLKHNRETILTELDIKVMFRYKKSDLWIDGVSNHGYFCILIDDEKSWKKNKALLIKERRKLEEGKVFGIYLTSSDVQDLDEILDAGYIPFSQKELLSVVKECKSINDVFTDYREYLECLVNRDYDRVNGIIGKR